MKPETRAPEYEDEPAPLGRHPESPVLNETEARQAVPTGHMRYVLAMVIIAFAVIYLTYFRLG
jgi:hypothetical protein